MACVLDRYVYGLTYDVGVMKHLLKAWREYKKFLGAWGTVASFEGFMDYLVNKESKRKKK